MSGERERDGEMKRGSRSWVELEKNNHQLINEGAERFEFNSPHQHGLVTLLSPQSHLLYRHDGRAEDKPSTIKGEGGSWGCLVLTCSKRLNCSLGKRQRPKPYSPQATPGTQLRSLYLLQQLIRPLNPYTPTGIDQDSAN
ncbi:hypothetical protein Baya_12917 [Bagarius yarrelli]|uniref:Uncharacterized protein n=1 Tax=Bagarius yarrelli TaxID=175774 RepID=A0A556V4Q4_BAGYA|nr:hypothetical protein Baya_12917 [Bagarius yarrelli]